MPNGGIVNVQNLFKEARRGIKYPLAFSVIFLLVALLYLVLARPLYEAKITITSRPTADEAVGGSKLLDFGSLGGLAGSKKLSSYDKLIALLISNDTASNFLTHGDLMSGFFPGKWSNDNSGTWRRPVGLRSDIRGAINRFLGIPAWTSPGAEPVLGLFDKYVRITPNDAGRSHTISFYAVKPETAYEALNVLLTSADKILRVRGQKASSEKLLFFRRQLADEQLIEVRTTLANEMGKEFITSAMLSGQSAYSYEILKEESVGSTPASPQPLLCLIVSAIAGILLGLIVIVFKTKSAQYP